MKGFLLFLFLLLIPSQLGRHFWPEWSYVLGIRVDYLSPTLYLIDLVWVGLLMVNLVKLDFFSLKTKLFTFKNLLVLGFLTINVLMAINPLVAVYKWLRLGQLLITFFYFKKNKELVKSFLVKIIPVWIIFEGLLAVAQIINNGSLGGVFYWLGERSFSFNTIGIAQMSVWGNGLIRAYGTFSHPNSLAGFLLVSLLIFYFLKNKINKNWWWLVFWFGFLGILVSGSRTILFLFLTLILVIVSTRTKEVFNKIAILFMFLGMLFFGLRMVNKEYQMSDFLSGWDSDGIEKRIQLNTTGLKMIKESPWFGIGLGNFLVRLPEFQKNRGIYWLQPVHNILILAWSQIGTLGMFLVFLFFSKNISLKKTNLIFKLVLGVIIISGMIDHYWLTLWQNVWLLVLVLGIV